MPGSSVPFSLPPFRGVVKRLVLATLAIWALLFLLNLRSADAAGLILTKLSLHPEELFLTQFWRPFTYPLVYPPGDVLGLVLSLLTLWFFGSSLQQERGGYWFGEFAFLSSFIGGLLGALLSRFLFRDNGSLGQVHAVIGLGPLNMLLILAFARLHPDDELVFNFILRLKAKYLAAIFVLLYVGSCMTTDRRLDLLVAALVALTGWCYLQFAPYRGFRLFAVERVYGVRNAYTRQKRRRAARQFKVYMKEQGKDVSLDKDGRYVSLEDERRNPNDRSWMN